MPLDITSCCGKSVNRNRSIWLFEPNFAAGDPPRAWPMGPVIFCPACWRKRDKCIAELEKARKRVSRKVKANV